MTLQEWCGLAGTHHTHPTTERGFVSVVIDGNNDTVEASLWHLTDYAAWARFGRVVWLAPRTHEGNSDGGPGTGV